MIIDKDTDLTTCTACGDVMLYWQHGGHVCQETINTEIRAVIYWHLMELGHNYPTNDLVEKATRAVWRWIANYTPSQLTNEQTRANQFRNMLEARPEYRSETVAHFVLDFLSMYEVDGVQE